ncbi:MAG: rhodanese-like domain-containing protein [Oligoflexia bacterium]|nr:rhodanese-like domain-containing protein [Oligoflexia bacterium]
MRYILTIIALIIFLQNNITASETSFDRYLSSFDYKEREEMKISAKELVELLKKKQVQLIDIRFKEEYALWKIEPSINIPINDLPSSLDKLDKNKLIVTACPHIDRASLARHYLTLKGYKSKYLQDGMIKLMENEMRGDNALKIYQEIKIK